MRGMRRKCVHTYHSIISIENLLLAWQEFSVGKKNKKDVQIFERNLMGNTIDLHRDLTTKTYKHSQYYAFNISDPKPRNIHKAKVRDRLLHHAIYRTLYPFFDNTFISHSYSCRKEKGTHKAINIFRSFSRKVSKNHTKTAWVLKCDIRKFFESINHDVLIGILKRYIADKDVINLLSEIIESFQSKGDGIGVPLGNLTSQLLVNIYMNEFDQFMKHIIKTKFYIRYADDFVILSRDKQWLISLLPQIQSFLSDELKLKLHPKKVSIHTLASGVDFLGWVHFPDHRVLRTATRKRMFRTIKEKQGNEEVVASYLGMLSHGSTYGLKREIKYTASGAVNKTEINS